MKICFASSECFPYIKTGGLADVSSSLPLALKKKGMDVKIFLPLYDLIDRKKYKIKKNYFLSGDTIKIKDEEVIFNVYEGKHFGGIDIYFIECEKYFNRKSVYTADADEGDRFVLFQHSILRTLQKLKWSPDVFHCNDWQTSLIPAMLKLLYSWDKLFQKSKTILSIHNIGYQGIFPAETIMNAGFPESLFVLGGPFEFNSFANFLKAGIYYSNAVSTVSPTYAKEIQTPEFGSGLDGVIKSRGDDVYGILNGIDTEEWSPETDKFLLKNYSFSTLENKKENKKHLLSKAGFDYNENTPLYGIISRLAWQKGFELTIELLTKRISENIQVIVLGSGEEKYESALNKLMSENPDKIYVDLGYNNELSHLITGGADYFLMPSRYEPCGLNQMYSLNYGTLPIVRKVGGLADTVIDIENNGNGFVFEKFTTGDYEIAFDKSLKLFSEKKKLNAVIKKGMETDFSWEKSAQEYINLYSSISNK